MTSVSETRSTTPQGLRGLLALTVLLITAYVVWTVPGVRPRPGFDKRFDGLLQGSAYSAVALVAFLAARRRAVSTPAWWWVVGALVLRAAAFDVSLLGLSLGRTPSYPSWADAGWVLSGLALFAALGLRLRELSPRLSSLVVLDGVSTALVALGATINVFDGPLRTLTGPGVPHAAIVMNVVYPVIDMGLLVLAAAALATARLQLTRSDLVLMGGVLGLVAVDVTYFVLLAEGLWRPGTLLASFSLVTTAVIAVAITTSAKPVEPRTRRVGDLPAREIAAGVVVPATLLCVLVVLLALSGYVIPAVGPALLCYIAGGVLAVTRGVRTVRSVQAEAGRVIGETSSDVQVFKSLVNASREFIGMADEHGRMLYLNPAGRRMLGMSESAEVTSYRVGDLASGRTPDELAQRWQKILRDGSWRGESEIVPVDGSPPVPVEISTFLIGIQDAEGRRLAGTIQRDISNRLRNEQAVRELAEQREELLKRLVEAEEAERTRIAHDVHDDPVQALAAVDLRLGLLRRRVASEVPLSVNDIDIVQHIVANATARLRNLLFDLESLPEGTTMQDAILEAAAFIFAASDIQCSVQGGPDLPLSHAQRVTAHRVVKEALVNVSKHSGARSVVVTLAHGDGVATITVDDDGRGIAPEDVQDRPGHLGLTAARDRAQVAGGSLEVGPRPGPGTRVRLTLPL